MNLPLAHEFLEVNYNFRQFAEILDALTSKQIITINYLNPSK